MGILEAVLLGIVQGLTEFLPISSSAHIVIVPAVLNLPAPDIYMVVAVHFGSLLAVLSYFVKDLIRITAAFLGGLFKLDLSSPDARLGKFLIVATIPAALVGLFGESYVEQAFSDPRTSGFFLLCTAAILTIGELFSFKHRNAAELTVKDSVIVGLVQALAVLPGISRSGSTISILMIRGLKRDEAARFSFLMSVVIIAGAAAVAVRDITNGADLASPAAVYVAGTIASMAASYLAISFLMRYLRTRALYPFAIYCLIAGSLTMIYL